MRLRSNVGKRFSKRKQIALVILSLLIIVTAAVLISILLTPKPIVKVTVHHGPLTAPTPVINKSAVLQYNTTGLASYALVSYQIANATSGLLIMNVYTKNPFQPVYVVNVSGTCISCFNENRLLENLTVYLTRYNFLRNASSFNYISLQSLAFVPSNSIVIVPSGIIPLGLVNNTGSGSIYGLLNKGDTVIYVGRNFSRSQNNGLILINTQSILSQLANYRIKTFGFGKGRQQNMTLFGTANGIYFKQPTYLLPGNQTYGNATFTFTANGTLVAFSNYQNAGWNNASEMASDISQVINERIWSLNIGNNNAPFNATANGNAGIAAQIANTTDINSTYSLITFYAANPTSNVTLELSFKNSYAPLGSLGLNESVAETQIIPITLFVQSSQNVLAHIDIYTRNMTYVGGIPIGFISSAFKVVKTHAFAMPSGHYILELKDFNNKTYASAYFSLGNVNITPTQIDFKKGVFQFSIRSNNIPLKNATYTISVNGAYNVSGTIKNGTITYSLPTSAILSYGTEQFKISLLGADYYINEPYAQSVFNIPPFYIEFGIAAVVIVLLNLILRPPQLDEYYIDVPDFLPTKKEKVKLNSSAIVGVFDKVNYYYRWRFMPLTADELRHGVGNNVRVNNMPIMITTHNANVILAELLEKGEVVGAAGYYAPKAWITSSKHDVEYLVVFRKLRDYCVAHALLFTDIEASDKADMLITKDTKQIDVFIYSQGSKARKLNLVEGAKNVIVFIDEESRQEFEEKLYSAYGEEAMMLKLGIEYNYVRLVDCEHLNQLIF